MGGNGAFVWCCMRKVYRLSENTLQTFSENSIDFLEKLYRLFPDTLQTFPRYLRTTARTAQEQRSVCMGAPLRSHRRKEKEDAHMWGRLYLVQWAKVRCSGFVGAEECEEKYAEVGIKVRRCRGSGRQGTHGTFVGGYLNLSEPIGINWKVSDFL